MPSRAASIPAPAAPTLPGHDASTHPDPDRCHVQVDGRPLRRTRRRRETPQAPPVQDPTISVDDRLHRRRSLPINVSFWDARPSTALHLHHHHEHNQDHHRHHHPNLGEGIHGHGPRHEITAAHRAAALRQLEGASRCRHRPSRSTGTRTDPVAHPVVVRTYSGTPPFEHRHRVPPIQEEPDMVRPELPAVGAFSFDDILKNVEPDVAGALDAIAGICASCKYSPSNHYDAHMPPHAHMDATSGIVIPPGSLMENPYGTAETVPFGYSSLDGMMSSAGPIAGGGGGGASSFHAGDAYHPTARYGSIDLTESAYHTVSQPGSAPPEIPSMALIDGSTSRRRRSRTPSAPISNVAAVTTPTAHGGPADFTGAPAPQVLTEVRHAVSVLEESEPRMVPSSTRRSSVRRSFDQTTIDSRASSMLEQFVSWFPWSTEPDHRTGLADYYRRGSADLTAATSSSQTAESRLRGLLATSEGTA